MNFPTLRGIVSPEAAGISPRAVPKANISNPEAPTSLQRARNGFRLCVNGVRL